MILFHQLLATTTLASKKQQKQTLVERIKTTTITINGKTTVTSVKRIYKLQTN